MLTVGRKQETNSSLSSLSPMFCWPVHPPRLPPYTDFVALYQRHLISSFAPIIIATDTRRLCHMNINRVWRLGALTETTDTVVFSWQDMIISNHQSINLFHSRHSDLAYLEKHVLLIKIKMAPFNANVPVTYDSTRTLKPSVKKVYSSRFSMYKSFFTIRGPGVEGAPGFTQQSYADHMTIWRKLAYWDRSHMAGAGYASASYEHKLHIKQNSQLPSPQFDFPMLLVPLATCPVFAYSHSLTADRRERAHGYWHIYQAGNLQLCLFRAEPHWLSYTYSRHWHQNWNLISASITFFFMLF